MSTLLNDIKKTEYAQIIVSRETTENVIKKYLVEKLNIVNEEINFCIDTFSDIPALYVTFEDDKINELINNMEEDSKCCMSNKIISDAFNYALGLPEETCTVYPDLDNYKYVECVYLEVPLEKIIEIKNSNI